MHELALAQNIIELLEEQAVNHQFNQVKQVWLEIGVMACVEVPALHFGLDVAARHTIAENARFHITIAPAQGWCLSCNQPFTSQTSTPSCPVCHSGMVQIDDSSRMRIREIEVE
ncbi:hydrogenase maturation nickel metallochaperone HypA [Salmonella enterica]|uniref:Hydrogenase maturation factor HypA n=2 Tax=Salmonella enterica TaxID=28901 RepID=A0A379SYN4_SALER|nr:hydrogenase maturation nickel metallochaperone HypA [Salmonella enterica]EBD1257672.1 hydrogenase maturation nickel metallochaperone HypA [Salmonella enterica subsp. arizonae serovar 62:z4,z32:-]EBH9975689.1 hydrogenase maturation nickel metallochaperone HypA [Salmonella enterica subsp. arizonae serovar 40:z36:-]ECF5978372.1 hydrogenase maturation nickel metallochaperone HypA [Salmonella enterica subsp. arizonae]ECU0366649.1 hydrogenase maturation nickel metallochaperone HypA [Salmonella ent